MGFVLSYKAQTNLLHGNGTLCESDHQMRISESGSVSLKDSLLCWASLRSAELCPGAPPQTELLQGSASCGATSNQLSPLLASPLLDPLLLATFSFLASVSLLQVDVSVSCLESLPLPLVHPVAEAHAPGVTGGLPPRRSEL